ncbi:MAG: hypothetical protein LUG98_08285 [Tannerellaceae bacterium]|nr:hypothetical protein [Tannerellaceae bacterium]
MKNVLLILFVLFISGTLTAQTVIFNQQITSLKMENGSNQWIDLSNNKPLKGKYKVVESPSRQNNYKLLTLKNGLIEGVEQTFRNGELTSVRYFKNGQLNGLSRIYSGDGQVEKEYEYKEGKLHGRETGYFSDGTIQYETNYKEGRPHGRDYSYWFEYEMTGEKILMRDHNYQEGKQHGKQYTLRKSDDDSDYTIEEVYDQGVLISYKETYLPGGELKKEIIDGVHIAYYKNGGIKSENRYTGPNTNTNTLSGEQKRYYPDGQLERIANYEDNRPVGLLMEYYPDGTLKLEEQYDGDARTSVEYYPNGQKQAEWQYRGIRRSGPYKLYYDDGSLKEEGEVDYDRYVWQKVYYRNGQLKTYMIVSNGVVNEVESYNEDGTQI